MFLEDVVELGLLETELLDDAEPEDVISGTSESDTTLFQAGSQATTFSPAELSEADELTLLFEPLTSAELLVLLDTEILLSKDELFAVAAASDFLDLHAHNERINSKIRTKKNILFIITFRSITVVNHSLIIPKKIYIVKIKSSLLKAAFKFRLRKYYLATVTDLWAF